MKKLIFFIVPLIFFACAYQKKYNSLKVINKTEYITIPAELLQYSQQGGLGVEKITLINDIDTFNFLWAERNKDKYPKPIPKTIDFKKQSVILVDFHRSNGGIPKKKLNSVEYKKDTCLINLSIPNVKLGGYRTMSIVKDYMFIATSKIEDNTPLKLKYIK